MTIELKSVTELSSPSVCAGRIGPRLDLQTDLDAVLEVLVGVG